MSTKFTPGPWSAFTAGNDGWFIRNEEDYIGILDSTSDQNTANVRLITTAPEMFAVLEELYALVKGECPSLLREDSGGDAALDHRIIETLKKARGES